MERCLSSVSTATRRILDKFVLIYPCLVSLLRRAAVSIPANIAEGFLRRGTSDKSRFYYIAQSSVEECLYYLILIEDLGYADVQEASRLIQEVSKLLEAYSKSILNSES